MPTIHFPQATLRSYLKGKPSDTALRDAMSMLGTDVDAFGKDVSVEIFPNRPDLLSVVGLARALNHFLGYTKGIDTYTTKTGKHSVEVLPSAANARPHTRCAIVHGLVFDEEKIEEIIELQEKLHVTFGRNRKKVAIGIYPDEHITYPITFGAEKPEDIVFTPLDGGKEMNAKEMLEEHPTGQKYGSLLDGKKLYPVFRDAKGNVLSVPPVINSEEAGRITTKTTSVFIEASGHEEAVLEEAIRIICCALADMGGDVETMELVYPKWHLISPDLSTQTMDVDMEYVLERADLSLEDVEKSIARMGLSIKDGKISIPPYRVDFLHAVDVVTDATIGYGYDKLPSRTPDASTIGKLDNAYVFSERVRDVLSGLGMVEIKNYSLTHKGVRLQNPLTEDYTCLRSTILDQLLDTLQKNVSNLYPQTVYELGTVFSLDEKEETGVQEEEHVCGIQCGENYSYTTIRQTLEALARGFGWDVSFVPYDDERFIPGRCARVSGTVHGVIGEVHPRELSERGIAMPASAFEVTL